MIQIVYCLIINEFCCAGSSCFSFPENMEDVLIHDDNDVVMMIRKRR